MNQRTTNYLHLAIQSVLSFFPAAFIGMALHEIGHGLGAWLSGLYFNGLLAEIKPSALLTQGMVPGQEDKCG